MVSKIDCKRCAGEGLIANDDEGSAWNYWRELPPGSDLAVRVGLIYPVRCPNCEGKGKIDVSDAPGLGSKVTLAREEEEE